MQVQKYLEFFSVHEEKIISDKYIQETLGLSDIGKKSSTINSNYVSVVFRQLVQEGVVTLRLVEQYISRDQRILEVGAGIGLIYVWLKSQGFKISGAEPSLSGHASYYEIGKRIMELCDIPTNDWHNLSASEVSQIGTFDFIFSNNVLEHLDDLSGSIKAMKACLSSKGTMRHNCPNYFVPYEPHFGIPLIPFFPKLTPFFFPRLKNDPLWNGLNFVSSYKLKKIFKKLGLKIVYDQHHFANTLERLNSDPGFQLKHRSLFIAFRFLGFLGLISVLKHIPARFLTPIQFSVADEA